MFQNWKLKSKKTFFLSLLSIFVALSFVLLAISMLILSDENKIKRAEVDISERSMIASEEYFITYKFNRLISDLRFICDSLSLNYPANGDFSKVAALWLSYSENRGVYDQIRFIDLSGNEVVRIDSEPGGPVVIAPEDLQNKSDRYYFQQAIAMNENQIYISPLDLNVENGAIELPIKPVIRFAMPFFGSDGVKKGIVILNYAASDILSQIASVAASSFGNVYLLNSEGYWLYNSHDAYTEWAFSYNPDSTVKFSNYYPKEWGMISAGGTGRMTTGNGYFSYAAISVNQVLASEGASDILSSDIGSLYIVSLIPAVSGADIYPSGSLLDLAGKSIRQYYLFYLLAIAISAVLAAYIASSRSKSKEVKFFSQFDTMTGALNRRFGIEKLSNLYKNLSKISCQLCICFIDVNGLKEVNDTLGHETGDELLVTVANAIRAKIRSDDFLVRLGGDEFLIVYTGIDESQAEFAWKRIVAEFEKINTEESRKYSVSVSHGVQALTCADRLSLDHALNQADVKMYEEKRRIKSETQIIRNA